MITETEEIPGLAIPVLSEFECSAERHLAKLPGFSAILYQFASRLCNTTRVYNCADATAAEYFGVSRDTIGRARRELEQSGFLVPQIKGNRFLVNSYALLSHDEWAKQHPGQCVERISIPGRADEGASFGALLYQIAGTRVRPRPRQLAELRKSGLRDDEIAEKFKVFVNCVSNGGHGVKCGRWASVLNHFALWLNGELNDDLCKKYGLPKQ